MYLFYYALPVVLPADETLFRKADSTALSSWATNAMHLICRPDQFCLNVTKLCHPEFYFFNRSSREIITRTKIVSCIYLLSVVESCAEYIACVLSEGLSTAYILWLDVQTYICTIFVIFRSSYS